MRVCMLACFPAGTPVSVEEGYCNIEDLQVDDRVWSRDEEAGLLALQPVVHTSARETDHLIHLRLGGERIQTTAEHPFYCKQARGWQKAGTLVVGDEVIRSDGQWRFAAAIAVTAVEHRTEFEQPQMVYNIEVAQAHTYFVGKWMWWVHNARICLWTAARAGMVYAQNMLRGIRFNQLMEKRIADGVHELWVDGMKYRLDTLIPGKKIISRKATQLAEISTDTAKKYIDELVTKYKKGTPIQNTKRAGAEKLKGKYTLQVPRQEKPIPKEVRDYAKKNGVNIEEIKDIGMGDLKNW